MNRSTLARVTEVGKIVRVGWRKLIDDVLGCRTQYAVKNVYA